MPPDDKSDWRRFADSDRDAGFEITERFERFCQRDDIFCRSRWDEQVSTEEARRFFGGHRDDAVARRGEGFSPKDFALRNAAWAVADDYAARNSGPKGLREGFQDPLEPTQAKAADTIAFPSLEAATAEIKHIARLFGADLAGITEFDLRWHYRFRADARTMEDKPNDLPEGLTGVIVLGHEMNYGLVGTYPSALAGVAVGLGYSKEAATAVQVSQYIRNLGYRAIASMNDTALVIPYAIKAGLGEYGRNQMVITKDFGPRVRFSKIFTDMPLVFDRPARHGVREFCGVCSRCADACPPKALPHGPPAEGGPNRSSLEGVVKWTADCEKCFAFWTKLRSDCAICMRVCPYNKDFSTWSARLWRRLAGTRARKIALWLDTRFGDHARTRPNAWWKAIS